VGDLNKSSIVSPVEEVIIMRALNYTNPKTFSEIRALLFPKLESKIWEVEIQSYKVIPKTKEAEY